MKKIISEVKDLKNKFKKFTNMSNSNVKSTSNIKQHNNNKDILLNK